jgi:hypothetical protein
MFAVVLAPPLVRRYVSTVAMMLGPQDLEPDDRELGGSTLVFCLLTGLTLGAIIGMIIGAAYGASQTSTCEEQDQFNNTDDDGGDGTSTVTETSRLLREIVRASSRRLLVW